MSTTETDRAKSLLESAFHLFSEQGISGVNMDAIAHHAGVTKGSLYHHFSSKKQVILGACDFYYGRWKQNTLGEIKDLASPLEQLEAAVRFSVRSCLLDRPNRVFTLEILTLSLHDADICQSWAGFYQSAADFYITLVLRGLEQNLISPQTGTPQRVNFMLCAMEGIKQQAHFDKSIRTRQNEQDICNHLLGILTR